MPFVASGAILAMSDYVDYMPHYQKLVKDWDLEGMIDNLRQADGKNYMLPGLQEVSVPVFSTVIRKDAFDEVGAAVPSMNLLVFAAPKTKLPSRVANCPISIPIPMPERNIAARIIFSASPGRRTTLPSKRAGSTLTATSLRSTTCAILQTPYPRAITSKTIP